MHLQYGHSTSRASTGAILHLIGLATLVVLLFLAATTLADPAITPIAHLPRELSHIGTDSIVRPKEPLKAIYPQAAIDSGKGCDLWLRVFINKKGRADTVAVFSLSDSSCGFLEAAAAAAYNGKFYKKKGGYWGYMPFRFVCDASLGCQAPADTVVTSAFGDSARFSAPKMIKTVNPKYPEVSKLFRESGKVYVRSLVSRSGEVLAADIVCSSGYPRLDWVALDAAYKNQYSPSFVDGKPSAVVITYKVTFSLEGER